MEKYCLAGDAVVVLTSLPTRMVKSWNGGKSLSSPTHQYTATALLKGNELAPTSIKVETSVTPWLQSAIYTKPVRLMRTWAGSVTRFQHGYLWGYVFTVLIAVLLMLLSVKII